MNGATGAQLADMRSARDAASNAVHQRKQEVEHLRSEIRALANAMAGAAAAQMARLGAYAIARREQLDDLLERAEYALIDDEETLARAQEALDVAEPTRTR